MKLPFKTIAISEGKAYPNMESWKAWIFTAINNGAEAIMIREPMLSATELRIIILSIIEHYPSLHILLNTNHFINDLPIIGFHHKSDTNTNIKPYKNEGKIIGKSCHSLADVLQAQADEYDYVFLSPIFSTITPKTEAVTPLGLEYLKMVCNEARIPVFALGGISPDNACLVMQNGAYGWAGIGSFLGKKGPTV
jgi:thiamine-phosphate pyrophosphorylase